MTPLSEPAGAPGVPPQLVPTGADDARLGPGAPPTVDDEPVLTVQVSAQLGSGTVVVELVGQLDRESSPLLDAHLMPLVLRSDPTPVTVDLRAVTFLGAAGLRVLATAHAVAKAGGAPLVLRCGGSGLTHRLLGLIGLPASAD